MTTQDQEAMQLRVQKRYEDALKAIVSHKERLRGWMLAMDGLVSFWRNDHPLNIAPDLWRALPDRTEFANAIAELRVAAKEYIDARADAMRLGFRVDGDVEEVIKGKP